MKFTLASAHPTRAHLNDNYSYFYIAIGFLFYYLTPLIVML